MNHAQETDCRRERIYIISDRDCAEVQGRFSAWKFHWPEGAEFIEPRHSVHNRSFTVRVRHESFARVPFGAEVPVFPAVLKREKSFRC